MKNNSPVANLFADLPAQLPEELCTTLLRAADLRIERIVSQGHVSPPGFWYDQDQHDWLMVLQGAALLSFEGDPQPIEMKSGDTLLIPTHKKHRVDWTTSGEPTIWLAVHWSG